eukprot:m.98673 g.98673  ORF g.98673 m.98673 type:complete len:812 (+) comp37002_c0_seq1:3-2438(+)
MSLLGWPVILVVSWLTFTVYGLDECDDNNGCTLDWLDAIDGCQHQKIECGCSIYLSTDVIFLIEAGGNLNRTKLNSTEKVIRQFRTLLAEDSDSTYRFLTLAYGTGPDEVLPWILQDFTKFAEFPNLQDEIGLGLSENGEEATLLAGLLAIRRILTEQTLAVRSGDSGILTEKPLKLRPGADVHLLVVTGVTEHGKMSRKLSSDFNEKSGRVLTDILNAASSLSVSIGVIIDESRQAAQELWGDPSLANAYTDFRSFNKAFTLKALIDSGTAQASSVQAHFLSKGIELRTFYYEQLAHEDCIRHMYRGYLRPTAVQPKYCNACEIEVEPCDPTVGCQLKRLVCDDRHYCSPVYGCIESGSHFLPTGSGFFSNADPDASSTWVDEHLIQGHVEVFDWTPDKPFAADLIQQGRPVVLKNAVPNAWPARRKWTMEYLSQHMGDQFDDVKSTNASLKITFDPDRRVAMANFSSIKYDLPYTVANMSVSDFFKQITSSEADNRGHYYFGNMMESLKADASPNSFLFASKEDLTKAKQFLWVSSPGMITHTHFDQDYNFFVQLYGKKEFTLWPSTDHDHLAPFPRIHPMWHKSRVHYNMPNITAFPGFRKARAWKAIVEPGDVLYIPPYHWHHVVSLTASVSVSTYSDDQSVYDHMNAIYGHDHKFDLLANATGRLYALRLHLDLLIHEIVGYGQTSRFFADLLQSRFSGLQHLFPVAGKENEDEAQICPIRDIPTARHVLGYAKLDVSIVANHFGALPTEVRDILFIEYVEEITAQVVGPERVIAFFYHCFRNQVYYITNIDDEEHALWDHKDDLD